MVRDLAMPGGGAAIRVSRTDQFTQEQAGGRLSWRPLFISLVAYWHKTDKPTPLLNVRYRVRSGKHLLAASISAFDHPKRTLSNIYSTMFALITIDEGMLSPSAFAVFV